MSSKPSKPAWRAIASKPVAAVRAKFEKTQKAPAHA